MEGERGEVRQKDGMLNEKVERLIESQMVAVEDTVCTNLIVKIICQYLCNGNNMDVGDLSQI